jgi:uncharacterized protein DUF4190
MNSTTPTQQMPASKTNAMAITSLVLGILSIPADFCYGSGILFGIAAIIIGLVARKQIKESHGTQGGNGLALAGIITGAVGGLLLGGIILIIAILLLLGPVTGNVFSNIIQNLPTPTP